MIASEGFVSTDDGVRLSFRAIGDGLDTIVMPNGLHLSGRTMPVREV